MMRKNIEFAMFQSVDQSHGPRGVTIGLRLLCLTTTAGDSSSGSETTTITTTAVETTSTTTMTTATAEASDSYFVVKAVNASECPAGSSEFWM